MATNGFHQALADLESLLHSRKRLINSDVAVVDLDHIILGRISNLTNTTTTADLRVDSTLLLSKLTLIRKQMQAMGFHLAAVDRLTSRVLRQMCVDEQVDQTVFETT